MADFFGGLAQAVGSFVQGAGEVAVDLIDKIPEIAAGVGDVVGSVIGTIYNGRHCWGSISAGASVGSVAGPLGSILGGVMGAVIDRDDCVDAVKHAFDTVGDVYETSQIIASDIMCPDGSIAVILQQVRCRQRRCTVVLGHAGLAHLLACRMLHNKSASALC